MPADRHLAFTAILAFAAVLPVHAQTKWTHPHSEVYVSPAGDDKADGSAAHPFRTLPRAQRAIRLVITGG